MKLLIETRMSSERLARKVERFAGAIQIVAARKFPPPALIVDNAGMDGFNLHVEGTEAAILQMFVVLEVSTC